jgi:acetyltransferase-like isoleucine patch superfamily enzyme
MPSSSMTMIHDRALVETDRIGEGTRIWAFAHIMPHVTIGRNCNIGDHVFIESHVTLGDNVTVKNGVAIWEHVRVEDNVFLGPNVVLTNDRSPRSRDPDWRPEETWLEEGVTIGANATLLCGVRLGRRCLVGAGAVVTRDVAPHALVTGNPARQRGWVCYCAQRLAPGAGAATCARCGRIYQVSAEGVKELAEIDLAVECDRTEDSHVAPPYRTRAALPIPHARVVAVPVAFNEKGKIERVLDRFEGVSGVDIVVVDDGSTDSTPDIVRSKGVALISHAERRGVGASIRTAYDWARTRGYDICVIMAGNDKDRAGEIHRLIDPIRRGEADVVQGSRYLRGGDYGHMPLYRRIATQFVHPFLFSLSVRRRFTDTTNGYRALRLAVLDDPRLNLNQSWLDKYELEPYLLFKMIRLGYAAREVPVTKIYPSAKLGYTKMKPITGWWSILRPILLLALGLKK